MNPVKTYNEMPFVTTPQMKLNGSSSGVNVSDSFKNNKQSVFGVDDAIGIGVALASLFGNIFVNKKRNETEERLQKQSQQWQEEQTAKLQEYNSPANQRQRLIDANINPLTGIENVASQMVANPGHANVTAPEMNAVQDATSVMSALSQQKLAKAQSDNLESQTELNRIDAQSRGDLNAVELASRWENINVMKSTTKLNTEQCVKIQADIDAKIKELDIQERIAEQGWSKIDIDRSRIELDKLIHSDNMDNAEKYIALESAKVQLQAILNSDEIITNAQTRELTQKHIQYLETEERGLAQQVNWNENHPFLFGASQIAPLFRDAVVAGAAAGAGINNYLKGKGTTERTSTTKYDKHGHAKGTTITERRSGPSRS